MAESAVGAHDRDVGVAIQGKHPAGASDHVWVDVQGADLAELIHGSGRAASAAWREAEDPPVDGGVVDLDGVPGQ